MICKTFKVPIYRILAFSVLLKEYEIVNSIKGTTRDGEIMVEVNYAPDDRLHIFELVELLSADDPEKENG